MKFFAPLVFFLASAASCAAAENAWQHAMEEGGDAFVMQQASSVTIKDETAKTDVTPQLELLCSPTEPTVTVRINWQRFISSFSTEAGFKVDGGKFTWLKLKVDSSEKVTYSSAAADSQKLVELLSSGNELIVDISPYSEAPVQAYFDVSDFATELSKLSANCQ